MRPLSDATALVQACGFHVAISSGRTKFSRSAISTAQLRERIDEAHRLLERRWTRDDLRALAVPVSAPWPSSRGRDAGAAAPAYADEGDRLIADLNDIASALRAVAEV